MKLKIFIPMILILFTVSCQSAEMKLYYSDSEIEIQYSETSTEFPPLVSTKEESLNVSEVIEEFQASRSLDNLEDMKLFWVDTDVYIDFYFNNQPSVSDIQSSIDYYNRIFVNEKIYGLGPDEISLVMENVEMNKRVLRIFVDEVLFIQTKYQEQDQFLLNIDYFENHLMSYGIREEAEEITKTLNKQSIKKVKVIGVTGSFKPFTYIASVSTSTNDDMEIEKIINHLTEIITEKDLFVYNNMNELIINISRNNKIIQSRKLIKDENGAVSIVEEIW